MSAATPRPRPCPSCPYRRDVPSGVWAASEYDKLPGYDGEIGEQAMCGTVAAFYCHQSDGRLCSGWVGHRDHPSELLAIRLGVLAGQIDPATYQYATDVELFASGVEAAEHGKREITEPSPEATAVVEKISLVRAVRGNPVTFEES